MSEPFAYICHRDNHWAGITSPAVGKRELKKFLGEFAADGFSIINVADRAEFDRVMSGMRPWHEHPDYQTVKRTFD